MVKQQHPAAYFMISPLLGNMDLTDKQSELIYVELKKLVNRLEEADR